MSSLILPAKVLNRFGITNGNLPIQQPYSDSLHQIYPCQATAMCEGFELPYKNAILSPTSLIATVIGTIPTFYNDPQIIGAMEMTNLQNLSAYNTWRVSKGTYAGSFPDILSPTRAVGTGALGGDFMYYMAPYDNGNHVGGGYPYYCTLTLTDPTPATKRVSFGNLCVQVYTKYPDLDQSLVQAHLDVQVEAPGTHNRVQWDLVLSKHYPEPGDLQGIELAFASQNTPDAWQQWGDWSGSSLQLAAAL